MPIRVDLPAPFSPTIPWIVPSRTASDTSRQAWAAPNDLSMPRSSMTGLSRRVIGDLDLAGRDVRTRLGEPTLHLRRDETAVVLVEREADPALGHAQDAHPGLPGSVLRGPEGVVDREIDALHHRGQDRAGLDVVLVRIHADRQAALVLGRLQRAEPGGPGRSVNDVGAAVELAASELAAARWIVPGGRRRPRHVLEDPDLGVDVPGSFLIAQSELADQGDVHPADEADLPGLRDHGRGHPHQEGSLVLLEDDGLDVGLTDHRVDDGELDAGKLPGHLLQAARLREADGHDDRRAPPRHVALGLLALGFAGHLELAIGDARVLLEPLRPGIRGLVE